jgi:hypothetical protein
MSVKTSKILNTNDKITKRLDVTDFKRGEITTKVQSLDGVPIITVPSARFWSEYTFKTGGTGQEAKGNFRLKPRKFMRIRENAGRGAHSMDYYGKTSAYSGVENGSGPNFRTGEQSESGRLEGGLPQVS